MSGYLKRNSLPSVSTLEAICKGFGITMSEFFAEGELIEVSPDTKQLIEYWAGLSLEQKASVLELVIVNDFNILTLDDYLSKMHCIVGSGN